MNDKMNNIENPINMDLWDGEKWIPHPYDGKLSDIQCKKCGNYLYELEESEGQICKFCADRHLSGKRAYWNWRIRYR
jgi:hypothetical protein